MAATLLLALLTSRAAALDLEARPLADGYRPGRWTPIRLVVSTGADPFDGEVVLRLESAQAQRVPLHLPAHARREIVVGVLPFSPAERVEIEAGRARIALDLRAAPEALFGAEKALVADARRDRGPSVAELGNEDAELWEGFDEVLVSRATAQRRWGLAIDGERAWARPSDAPWGTVWTEGAFPRRPGVSSIRADWMDRLPPSPWGPEARVRALLILGACVAILGVGAVAGRRRTAGGRALAYVLSSAAACAVVAPFSAPQPAVTAIAFEGRTSGARWQVRGLGCASRGADGDLSLALPGVPRPLFASITQAQEASWGVVWGETNRLVFPSRSAGEGCWFEWQAEAKSPGRIVATSDGGAANETSWALSPSVLIVDGKGVSRDVLPAGEAISPGGVEGLPAGLTKSLLASLDHDWRRGKVFLGRIPGPLPGLSDVDVVDGRLWLWLRLD